MPRKGKSPLSQWQKRAMATGKVLGRPNAEIARRAGVAVTTVAHAASRPDIRALMARLAEEHEADHAALYDQVLAGVQRDLEAEEWQARAEARKQALAIIAAGDHARGLAGGGQGQPSQAGQHTLTEILMVLRQAQTPACPAEGGGAEKS